ncbi:MAG: hypothetical protein JNN28_09080 [Saprospiraceae bacterium]|nr:hypothetical protein [Saprospiraceae bacterium]
MKGVEQIEHTLHNIASPKRGHTFWGMVGVLAIATLLISIEHRALLKSPNDVIIANSSDGFKSYMTALWHVKNDSSYVHFAGMNYPSGEHVLFTDNQPIVCNTLQWWSGNMWDVKDRVIGFMHITLVLSMIFGAGMIYLLLRKLHLPVWVAGWAALGMAFLSPQYGRFDGHFGMAHIWVLPMLLFLLCRYEERSSRRYQSLLIGALVWVSAQLHFYNLGVSAIFLGFYTVFQIGINPSWRNIWTRASHFTVMVLLPFALLNVWLHWSDYFPDRPISPYGFTDYIGRWEGVFLPYPYFPLHHWISDHIVRIRSLDFEAEAYVGLAATIFTIWYLFVRRFKAFESDWDTAAYHRVHKNYLRGISFAAFFTLLFGLGFPFAFNELEWLVNYMGPLRQFRGLGRFTWAFFYVINLLTFYVLWNRSVRYIPGEKWMAFLKKYAAFLAPVWSNIAKYGLLVIPLTILSAEAYVFQKNNPLQLVPSPAKRDVAAPTPDHWLNKVDFGRYQALMPLPYYHIGSENMWLNFDFSLIQKVQITAYHTAVPDMGVMLSRTSVNRTIKSIQFSLLACEPPELLSELPDNRPIALMIQPETWESTRKRYAHLIDKARTVYNGPDMRIMSLIPDSIRIWWAENADAELREMERNGRYTLPNGLRSDQAGVWYKRFDFDDRAGEPGYTFQGQGAGTGLLSDTTRIWNGTLPKGVYTFSIWIKANEDMGLPQEYHIRNQGKVLNGNLGQGIQTIVQGWALCEIPFDVTEEGSQVDIFLHKKDIEMPFWYDEGMIKAQNSQIYLQKPGWLMHNNFWYKLPVH